MKTENKGILQIEENEIRIVQRINEEKQLPYFKGQGKNRQKYILIKIEYNVGNLEEFHNFSDFHNNLEKVINKINKNYEISPLLNYFGVYYSKIENSYFLVYEYPKYKLTDYLKQDLTQERADLMLIQVFNLVTEFYNNKVVTPLVLANQLLFMNENGDFKFLYLGELKKESNCHVSIPSVDKIYQECENNIKNLNDDYYSHIINQFIRQALYIYTRNESYLDNNCNVIQSQLPDLLPDYLKRFTQYYLNNNGEFCFDFYLEYLQIKFKEYKVKEKENLVVSMFSIDLNQEDELKLKRVDEGLFFDQIFQKLEVNCGIFESRANNMLINITNNEDDGSIKFILSKLFNKENEGEKNNNLTENPNQMGINAGLNIVPDEIEIESLEPFDEDLFNQKIRSIDKEKDKLFKIEKLNFMIKHFPSDQLYLLPGTNQTIFQKELEDYIDNCVDKNSVKLLGRKRQDNNSNKSDVDNKNEILRSNKLFRLKSQCYYGKVEFCITGYNDFLSSMEKVWDSNKFLIFNKCNNFNIHTEEEICLWLKEIEKIWPRDITSFKEDKCLRFLDICNYDMFKSYFYISSLEDVFLQFIQDFDKKYKKGSSGKSSKLTKLIAKRRRIHLTSQFK